MNFTDKNYHRVMTACGSLICGSAIAMNYLQGHFTPINEAMTVTFVMGLVPLFIGIAKPN